ncbi:MAG: hypothetical protein NZ920_03540 [Aigarchaeota archaeon]|nr:hypothetical protein [Aigarchaeota archaeon]MDW8092307.1 hypothetical protein [Nitrososphaerota archaeon]
MSAGANVIQGCKYREDLLYSYERNLWFEVRDGSISRLGLLPITQALFGKIRRIKLKGEGTVIEPEGVLFMIEGRKFLGNVHSPIGLRILRVNEGVSDNPHRLQIGDYEDGWIYEAEVLDRGSISSLQKWDEISDRVAEDSKRRGLMCFDHVPDHVYAAIGVDCAQVLMVLSDMINSIPPGEVVHVVAEYSPGSDEQLRQWSEFTGNVVLDFRIEQKLAHVLIKKT